MPKATKLSGWHSCLVHLTLYFPGEQQDCRQCMARGWGVPLLYARAAPGMVINNILFNSNASTSVIIIVIFLVLFFIVKFINVNYNYVASSWPVRSGPKDINAPLRIWRHHRPSGRLLHSLACRVGQQVIRHLLSSKYWRVGTYTMMSEPNFADICVMFSCTG